MNKPVIEAKRNIILESKCYPSPFAAPVRYQVVEVQYQPFTYYEVRSHVYATDWNEAYDTRAQTFEHRHEAIHEFDERVRFEESFEVES